MSLSVPKHRLGRKPSEAIESPPQPRLSKAPPWTDRAGHITHHIPRASLLWDLISSHIHLLPCLIEHHRPRPFKAVYAPTTGEQHKIEGAHFPTSLRGHESEGPTASI